MTSSKDLEAFYTPAKAYWTWKIGWMLTGLLTVLALGSAVLLQTPAVGRLSADNHTLVLRLRELRDDLEDTRIQLREARDQSDEFVDQTDLIIQRNECRNALDLVITNAQINNTLAQNEFVVSLAAAGDGKTIAEVALALKVTNTTLTQAVANRNNYEADATPLPCPVPSISD